MSRMFMYTCLSHSPHTEILEIGNMREVIEFFWEIRSEWKLIGIQLEMDMGTLRSVDRNNRTCEDCLIELADRWLRRANPMPTRSAMAAVLQSRTLDGTAGDFYCENFTSIYRHGCLS